MNWKGFRRKRPWTIHCTECFLSENPELEMLITSCIVGPRLFQHNLCMEYADLFN
jgi:hypothetical protein